jgi:GNAT superfamily N-acetyltransferase
VTTQQTRLPRRIGVGYVATLSINLTPLTDPDYRPLSHRIAWLASDPDGNPVGSAYLRLFSKASYAHLTELELAVHPAERRKGIGTRLMDAAAEAARDHKARIVLADAGVGAPGDHFLSARGFTVGVTLHFTRLAVADVDNAVLAGILDAEHPGYRLVSWQGVAPDELVETFTDTRSAMDDAPVGDIDYGPEEWDVDRTRSVAQVVEKRGDHLSTIAAVEEATGRIVGFTELVVASDGKGDGQHCGTAVLPAHRGHGLARWLKAESIRQARACHPDLDGLLTDMVDTNAAMIHVNDQLGYRLTHRVHRYVLQL